MGGGLGALILVLLAVSAVISILILTLSTRSKSTGSIFQEARENIVGTTILSVLALIAVAIAVFVVVQLL